MASITEHVIKLQELTQKNLEILQSLNDSFFTNQTHLSVRVGDNQYAIPSFISLENKLNSLTANFENLIHAPETGEAFFDFNGNSRAIQVRSYTSTPNSLVLDPVAEFKVDQNDIFKDFLTPNPYIHLNAQSLPNDVTQVMVKKIIPISNELKQLFKSFLVVQDGDKTVHKTSIQYNYKELYKILDLYKHDIDYIEYDTKTDLPIRKNIGSGTYVIEDIIEDVVDENLDNYLTLKFRSDVNDPTIMPSLKYRLFDETIEKMLKVGDELVTYEGNAKMQITEIRTNTNTVVVKVLHGDFLNLVPSLTNNPTYIPVLSKVKFYSPIDFNEDKYVKVPLEEDQYVFIAVAALNSRMNVQSSWGGGIMLDTFALKNGNVDFKTYYDENVKNVGDILFEMTSMMSNTLTKYTKDEYDEFTQFIPSINENDLQVIRINNHLNDSVTIQKIHSLYSQKSQLYIQLEDIQNQINDTNEVLAAISYNDINGQRRMYEDNLSKLNVSKNELLTAITNIISEISDAANNSEVPIENAKYRIRGFFDTSNIKWDDHIKGIRVQYRYKNANNSQNKALTIDDKFMFSDWNNMESFDRQRIPVYENGSYKSIIEPKTDNINEPSFNQIDIPISQGESVDIRLKVVYDFGAPFVQTTSKWSPIVNISFPEEFLKSIEILDIINENNDEIESNKINNIIKDGGITDHISDKLVDQSIIYYHKPENIASGFYTAERRIIPLKDKLTELNNMITQLKDEIYSYNSDQLTVSIVHGDTTTTLIPLENNNILTRSRSELGWTGAGSNPDGDYILFDEIQYATTVMYLSLYNNSDHTVKLFSMFPGSRDVSLNPSKTVGSRFNIKDYAVNIANSLEQGGVWIEHPSDKVVGELKTDLSLQSYNQFIYFRINDISTGDELYTLGDVAEINNKLSLNKDYVKISGNSGAAMHIYPKLSSKYNLCFDSKSHSDYLLINPKENIMIPLVVEFRLDEPVEGDNTNNGSSNANSNTSLWTLDDSIMACKNKNGEMVFLRAAIDDNDKKRAYYSGLNSSPDVMDGYRNGVIYEHYLNSYSPQKKYFKAYRKAKTGETADITDSNNIGYVLVRPDTKPGYNTVDPDYSKTEQQSDLESITHILDPTIQIAYTMSVNGVGNDREYYYDRIGGENGYVRRAYENKYVIGIEHYWDENGKPHSNHIYCTDYIIPKDKGEYVYSNSYSPNGYIGSTYPILKSIYEGDNTQPTYIQKTMSFDIWTSLYKDPTNYKFTITSKLNSDAYDMITTGQKSKHSESSEYTPIFK